MLDILIKNGLIVDGTKGKPRIGDVGIKDGKIASIGRFINDEAGELIDALGLIVAPGFIDVHSHNDLVPLMNNEIENLKLMQGVTTEVVGQCGLGVVPCREGINGVWKNYIRGVVGDMEEEWHFKDAKDYINKVSTAGLKNNYAFLVSHGAVRTSIMGFDNCIPSENQLKIMCKIVDESMEGGALGMSIGLQYMPAIFSKKDELIKLCQIVKKYNGVVMVHLRNHDSSILDAMDEVVEITEKSEVKLHISHMRSYNSRELGCSAEGLINYVEVVANRGIAITFDEHLYLSGSTLMTQLFPPWVSKNGTSALIENLRNKELILRIKDEIGDKRRHYKGWDNYSAIAGFDGILITSVKKEENFQYIGKTVGELSRVLGIHPIDFMAKLLIEENGGVGIVTLKVFSEEDTIRLIKHPLQMVGSDSIPAGVPHPRLYGNYPLYFGKYVREKKSLTIEEAVYKTTLLPARTLGISDRGELVEGKIADLCIFDFHEIIGYEDYINPTKPPRGIKYVILNGKVALYNGEVTEVRCGKMIKGQ